MNKNLIGNLSFSGVNDELISTKLYEKIENGKFECYPTLYQPWGIIELSNNQILCASIYDSCNLTLHDENFELLRLVEKIDNKNFRPIGITSNNRDEIYINDEKNFEKKLALPTIRSILHYICEVLPPGRTLLRRAALLGLGVALHFFYSLLVHALSWFYLETTRLQE